MWDVPAVATRLRDIDPSRFHVVALPDFFLDHFIHVPSWSTTLPSWQAVHERGGGNVPTPGQHFQAGGNAANTALSLARLGVRTHLVAQTSPFGRAYLDQTLAKQGVDIHHVRSDGRLAVTTAIEFQEGRPTNLMLSDPGSVAEYGPDRLDANDWTLLEAADMVLVANWSQNRHGTALVEAVAHRAKRTMLDTGDPSARASDIKELREHVLPLDDLDVYALNENELRQLVDRPIKGGEEERDAARSLHALRPNGILDLHTAMMAATFGPDEQVHVPTFRVDPRRVTGAGDAWNAGNLLGHLADMRAEERLIFANAVAALYISSAEGLPPRMADVARFLSDGPTFRNPS